MKDAYYFSHDSNARTDPKILALINSYGMAGYGRYWVLVEMLSEQKDYELQMCTWVFDALAMQWQCERNAVEEFLNACIDEYELFVSDGTFFWSESLKRRMQFKNEKREKRSAAARKAAAKRWETSERNANALQDNANACQVKESKVKESKAKESSIDSPKATDTDKEEHLSKSKAFDYQAVVDLYHELCPSLSKVMKLNANRKTLIKARHREHGFDGLATLFTKAESSDFLSGRSGKWKGANFDWLLKDSNCLKVLEGNYDNTERRTVSGQVSGNERSGVSGISLSMSEDRGSSKWDHLYVHDEDAE